MRPSNLLPRLALLALLGPAFGCTLDDFDEGHQREVNAWMNQTLHNAAGENAIITQHTLYPYHFEAGSAELTPLGRKNLRTLAGHYREHPGPLNLRKGDAPVALYTERVEEVKRVLEDGGVDVALVPIRDGSPGGDGMSSEDVLIIRQLDIDAMGEGPGQSSSGESSGSSGSSARRARRDPPRAAATERERKRRRP